MCRMSGRKPCAEVEYYSIETGDSVYGRQDFRMFSAFSGVSIFPTLCLTVANISLAGFPFISGFFSKDAILESFYNSGVSLIFQLIFLLGVGLTTVYSVKMTHLAFLGGGTGGAADLIGGGSGFVSKMPLSALFLCSVRAGAVLMSSLVVISPVVCSIDKLMPMVCISAGVFGGLAVSKAKASILSSMWYLAPFAQHRSQTGVRLARATEMDRGLYNIIRRGGLAFAVKEAFAVSR